MLYGYARCSTNETKQDIDRQKRELKKAGVKETDIFYEYESGAKVDRVQLNRLLNVVVNPGETIVTTEVSRLARSTQQLCDIIELAKNKKIRLIIGSFIADCRNDELDPMTEGMLMMWGVFAQMERAITRQRVRSGMENARAKGVVLGRPETTIDNLPDDFIRHYPLYASKQLTQAGLARVCNVSRQSINKYIKIYKTASTAK